MTSKLSRNLRLVFSYAFLIALVVIVFYPIAWAFMGSLNPGDSLSKTKLFTTDLSFKHYIYLFKETNYLKWYWNTLKIALGTMVLSTIFVVSAGYAFSRYRFKGRKYGLMTMLVLQMFPSFMGMIAIFLLLDRVGLLDTHIGLILVYSGGGIPFGAWLVKGYFDGIPKSLEEAARIDGAGHITVFFKVMVPLARPILVFVAVNNFIGPWMDFIFARLVLTSPEKKTLAIGLFDMITGKSNTQFTNFAAGAVLVAIPITILFILFQKHIVEGLKAGANKG
ncbi:sugar ABC transporter permease [Peribacillus deserti]|uniref:Sugar ABC transporter permease n=1 Tax=Peribacillus deserti TaxID=673318 RepID=A0A2N5M525_9BACI|nr:sugar ABC transporter permease [Peribacillus deserti]PLT29464.1 sugar ABC transporter permease [Peribacillus deserti]